MFKKDKQDFNYTEKVQMLVAMTRRHFSSRVTKIYADILAKYFVKQAIKENRIEECFSKMIAELFKKQDYKTLYQYGVLN